MNGINFEALKYLASNLIEEDTDAFMNAAKYIINNDLYFTIDNRIFTLYDGKGQKLASLTTRELQGALDVIKLLDKL